MTAASEEVKQTTKLQDVPHDLSDRTMNHIANLLVDDPQTHMHSDGSVHPSSGEQVSRRSQWPTSLTPSRARARYFQLVSEVLSDLNTTARAANVWRYSAAESTCVLCQLSSKSNTSPITQNNTVLKVSALKLCVQTRTLSTIVRTDSGLSVEGLQQFSLPAGCDDPIHTRLRPDRGTHVTEPSTTHLRRWNRIPKLLERKTPS